MSVGSVGVIKRLSLLSETADVVGFINRYFSSSGKFGWYRNSYTIVGVFWVAVADEMRRGV